MNYSRLNCVLLFSLLIASLSCSRENNDDDPPINGLVSFYTFQGNANDIIGDNNGTGYNATYVRADNNEENLVLRLNGINSYINLADSFDYENRTINLWLNVTEATDELDIIYVSDNPGLNFGMTILSTQLIDSQPTLVYNISGQLDTIGIELNTWYNATLVSYGMNYAFYLNNNLFKSDMFNTYISSYNGIHSAIIGTNRIVSSRFFNGMVDNLRIYNRRLSDNEINNIFNAAL